MANESEAKRNDEYTENNATDNASVETEAAQIDNLADLSREDLEKEVTMLRDLSASLNEEVEFYKGQLESIVEKLKKTTVQAAKAEEFAAKLTEVQRDFENFKKRNADVRAKALEDGLVKSIEKLLPITDNFRRSIVAITDEKTSEGVKLIYRQIIDMLSSVGVSEIPALGQPFDPNLHNAVMQVAVKDPSQSGLVVEVFQKGYMLSDRVIRYSQVKVAK